VSLNQPNKLSVVMIARNAEKQIEEVLESVKWADELCVADTGSEDNTREKAAGKGAKVTNIEFTGFGKAKQKAVDMASYDWVFSLDSDEVVTPQLKDSIQGFLTYTNGYVGAEFKRATYFCGSWIRYSGWYPEYIMRIFDKTKAGFNDKILHESIEYEGKIKRLDGHLLHYSYPTIKTYIKKAFEYARLGAEKKRKESFPLKLLFIVLKPVIVFFKKFILQLGCADGFSGLWIAGFAAFGQILKYYYALRK